MKKITAIASFELWWDCPYCGKDNKQTASCAQLDTSCDGDWNDPAILKKEIERKCRYCEKDVIINSVTY